MGWFSKEPESEEQEPAPVRLASAEFVSALTEVAEIYEAREKQSRENAVRLAAEFSLKTGQDFFNYGQSVDRYIGELRLSVDDAVRWHRLAGDVRDWIRRYEYQGRRPPYMPAPPPAPAKLYLGGE